MPEKPTHSGQNREVQIDEAFGEYLSCLDAGQPMNRAEFLAKYPDIADSLEKCLEDESTVRKMAGPTFAETDQQKLGTVIGPIYDPAVVETGTYFQSVDAQSEQSPVDRGIPEQFGYYRVKKLLGQGAMGAVYLAHDMQLDRPVALKIPKFDQQNNPALLERFYREARAVATLHHPNICPVYDVGEIEGQVFLSMAFIKGHPLSDFTKSDKQQSQCSVAKLTMKIAMALQATHEIGVVHRDLKPANIMVNAKGEPVVMDFGLARRLDSQEARVTQSGYIVGTPAYMSPEQVSGDPDGVGPKSDQYSLGVVFYELLTGQMPFSGSVFSIIGKIAHKAPRPLQELRSDVDPRLADICNKMMAKDQSDRFEDMTSVAEALNTLLTESKAEAPPSDQSMWDAEEAISAEDSVAASQQRLPKPSGKESSIHRWVLLLGAMVLLAILAGVVIFFQNSNGTVRIEITDPKIRVSFADQTFTIEDNGSEINVIPGKLKLHVEREGLKLDTEEITISRNGMIAIKATFMDGELAVSNNGQKIAGTGPVVTTPRTESTSNPSPKSEWKDWPKDAPPPAITPFNAQQAQQHQEAWAKYLGREVETTNSLGMKIRLIPPGEFLMGSTQEEIEQMLSEAKEINAPQYLVEKIPKEGPQHKVRITRPFAMGQREVTRGHFRQFVDETKYETDAEKEGSVRTWDAVSGQTDEHPVVYVTWNDAKAFCDWLSEIEDVRYRLPSQAEWEHACRAGSTTRYFFGDDPSQLGDYAWVRENVSGRTKLVGQKKPNPYGLFDMHGNVMELCDDGHRGYSEATAVDPRGNMSAPNITIRGGSVFHPGLFANSAFYALYGRSRPAGHTGFRVVAMIEPAVPPKPAVAERLPK